MSAELMTTRELADYLGMSLSTIYRWERDGTAGPRYVTPGRRQRRYYRSDVDAWLNRNATEPTEETE